MYFKKLIGKKCYLSPIDVNDAHLYTAWLNDSDVNANLTLASAVISLEAEKEFLQKLAGEHNYAIVDIETDSLIGNAGLQNVSHLHRSAEIGIFIGDKNYWNKGYGTEAVSLLIDYSYAVLNLHNISLKVYSFNKRAIRCYEKIGFKKAGELREALMYGRKAHNIILMDILPDDFYGGNKRGRQTDCSVM